MATQTTTTQVKALQRMGALRQWRPPSFWRVLLHLILIIGAALCLFPFVFMIIKSLSSVYEANRQPPVWVPSRLLFLNFSVSWSRVPFGPTVKVVEGRNISEAYVEFWAVFLIVANFLLASLVVGWLIRRRETLREKPAMPVVLFAVLLLPTLILLLFGAPCRLVSTDEGHWPTTSDGAIKPLELLGYDRNWDYRPPPEYLTSWDADRALKPAIPISVGRFIDLAVQPDNEFLLGNVLNTIIVAGITVPSVLLTSILSAYVFARMEFFGKNLLFVLFLSTLMIPFEAILVPNFIIVAGALRWKDTFQALSVPFTVSVLNIFLLRQFFMSIPNDYYDAARLDGAGHMGFLRHVVLPMSRSPLAVVMLFTFLGVWNSFQWPIIAGGDATEMIQIGMSNFRTEGGSDPQLIMAAATFSILPVVILYFLTQKTFIESVASSGLKG